MSFDGTLLRPLLAEGREHVWHIGTLSKTLCPGLRLGWLVPPRPMCKRVIDLKLAMRLCYSATPPKQLTEAVQRLARAWQHYRR